jgi:hypothetical protein
MAFSNSRYGACHTLQPSAQSLGKRQNLLSVPYLNDILCWNTPPSLVQHIPFMSPCSHLVTTMRECLMSVSSEHILVLVLSDNGLMSLWEHLAAKLVLHRVSQA